MKKDFKIVDQYIEEECYDLKVCEAWERIRDNQQPTDDKWKSLEGAGLDKKLTSWEQPTDDKKPGPEEEKGVGPGK